MVAGPSSARRRARRWGALASGVVLLLVFPLAIGQTRMGALIAFEGEVWVKHVDAPEFVKLPLLQPEWLICGDQIKTIPAGQAELRLEGGGRFVVKTGSLVTVRCRDAIREIALEVHQGEVLTEQPAKEGLHAVVIYPAGRVQGTAAHFVNRVTSQSESMVEVLSGSVVITGVGGHQVSAHEGLLITMETELNPRSYDITVASQTGVEPPAPAVLRVIGGVDVTMPPRHAIHVDERVTDLGGGFIRLIAPPDNPGPMTIRVGSETRDLEPATTMVLIFQQTDSMIVDVTTSSPGGPAPAPAPFQPPAIRSPGDLGPPDDSLIPPPVPGGGGPIPVPPPTSPDS